VARGISSGLSSTSINSFINANGDPAKGMGNCKKGVNASKLRGEEKCEEEEKKRTDRQTKRRNRKW
jgi:hypothetical protein